MFFLPLGNQTNFNFHKYLFFKLITFSSNFEVKIILESAHAITSLSYLAAMIVMPIVYLP